MGLGFIINNMALVLFMIVILILLFFTKILLLFCYELLLDVLHRLSCHSSTDFLIEEMFEGVLAIRRIFFPS